MMSKIRTVLEAFREVNKEEQMNTELHERTFKVLCKVAPDLTNDELSLLCWHCGISYKEIVDASEEDLEPQERRHFLEDAIDAAEHFKER